MIPEWENPDEGTEKLNYLCLLLIDSQTAEKLKILHQCIHQGFKMKTSLRTQCQLGNLNDWRWITNH